MGSLKEQYEQMLDTEKKKQQPGPQTIVNILRSYGCSVYPLKIDETSKEAADLVKPEKWKSSKIPSAQDLKDHVKFTNAGKSSSWWLDLNLILQIRTDEGEFYAVSVTQDLNNFTQNYKCCKTSFDATGVSGALAKSREKKVCLQKAEELMNQVGPWVSGPQLYTTEALLVEISDSGSHRCDHVVLFRDGHYYWNRAGYGNDWLTFLKQVNR